MNAIASTPQSTARILVLSSAVLAIALVGSGGIGISAIWVAPMLAVAACLMKQFIERAYPDAQEAEDLLFPVPVTTDMTEVSS